jgi:hypothetical protein
MSIRIPADTAPAPLGVAGASVLDWLPPDTLPGLEPAAPVVHPPREAAALGPEGPLGGKADGPNPSHTRTQSRSNGTNYCAPGQDADNGADDAARAARRVTKFGLREVLRHCTVHEAFLNRLAGKLKDDPADGERMGGCGAPMHGMARVRGKGGISFFSGIETCKSRLCPVCGPRIAGRRARDFTQAVGHWHDRGPAHEVWFVRLSAQNMAELPLSDGVERAAKGFQRLVNRRLWRELRRRYGCHYIKVREETYGSNGWNVHLHLAIATAPTCHGPARTFAVDSNGQAIMLATPDSGQVLAELSIALRRLWPDVMARLGYHADPMYGIHIEQVTPAIAGGIGSYMAKESAWDIGSELASGVAKLGRPGHRTYEQVVADYDADRREADLKLIHEYHEAMYGRRHCSWSEGFRELLNMGPEESDEELAGEDEEPPGEDEVTDLAVIEGRALYTMLVRRQVPVLLEHAERDGIEGIRAYVVGKLGYPPGSVMEPRPDLTRRQPPRAAGGRVDRTDWGGERHHVGIATVHGQFGPPLGVAGCICEACRELG